MKPHAVFTQADYIMVFNSRCAVICLMFSRLFGFQMNCLMRAVSAVHPLANMMLGIYLCVARQRGSGTGSQWKNRSFSKVSHLTAAVSERFGRCSQPSAKTYLLLDAIEAESERTTTHNGNVHTADDLVDTVTRFKRPEKG